MAVRTSVKISFFLLLIISLVCITLLSLEIYFRLDGRNLLNGIQYNSTEIWRWRKNVCDKMTNYDEGLNFTIHTDKFGFRNYGKQTNKPENVIRILVLGDSYTAGLGYPDDKIFTALLEKNLADINPGGKKIEVINAAAPAWSTEQQLLCMKNECKEFEPDYVLLMVCPNDIREAYCKKFSVLGSDGAVNFHYPDFTFKELLCWQLSTRSSFFQWIQNNWWHSHYGGFEQLMEHFTFNFGKEDSKDWDRPLYLKAPFDEVNQAQKLFQTLVGNIHQECNNRKISFAVSLVPEVIEFNSTIQADTALQSGLVSFKLQHYCDSTGVDYVNLYERFKSDPDPTSNFLKSDFHFNTKGHFTTATGLTEYYRKVLKK